MNDITPHVQLSARHCEDIISNRNLFVPINHILFKTAGSKSAIGDFGELLCYHMFPDKWSWRTNPENDKVHKTLNKCEIKTTRSVSDWYNQIRFNKDWDTLILVDVFPDKVRSVYAKKTQRLQNWDKFEINNDYTLKNKRKFIFDNPESPFKIFFEGTYT